MEPFRLESVLRFRKQKEDGARQQLFQAREEEARISQELNVCRHRLSELYTNLAREKQEGTTADRLLLFENRIVIEQETFDRLKKKLEEQKSIVSRRQRRLLKASKERKALDKLKQRQNLAYRRHQDKQEAIILDEIAVLRHRK